MAYLNQLICAALGGNTGLPSSCTHNPDLLVGMLAVPKGTAWDAGDLADIQTVIQAGLVNDTYASRYHLFGQFEGIEDQSEERQQQTYGYGRKVTTRDAVYYWNFTYIDGAHCAHLNYLKFKGREREYEFFLIDKSRNIIGTTKNDAATNEVLFRGLTLSELYENNWKPKDGTNETVYMLSVGINDAKQLNEFYGFVKVDFDVFALNQVKDVRIAALGALNGTGTVNIGLYSGCGSQNLVNYYGSAIANTARFSARNTQTNGTITISSVTIGGVGQNSYLIFDMDSGDSDYPASGDYLTIDLVAPSTLVAANLDYFDGEPLKLAAA